jgi:pyridoxine 4-dehydrogenase
MVDLCEQERMTFLPWAPILDIEDTSVVADIAKQHGATPRQVVLAWLLARSPSILPIPGTGSIDHVEENIAAASLALSAQEVATLSRSSR